MTPRPHLTVIAGRPVTARPAARRPQGRELEWLLPLLIVASATVSGLLVWWLTWPR